MARLSQLQRKVNGDEKLKVCAALFLLLITIDAYSMVKIQDKDIRLVAYIGVFKKEFIVQSEFDLAQKLGDWLVSLPKGVWKN